MVRKDQMHVSSHLIGLNAKTFFVYYTYLANKISGKQSQGGRKEPSSISFYGAFSYVNNLNHSYSTKIPFHDALREILSPCQKLGMAHTEYGPVMRQ